VFVAVQTPHAPAYGGEVPAPPGPRDFEYAFLVQAVRDICAAAAAAEKPITLAVVSTVLPGTCNRLIRPLAGPYVTLVYTPVFIAMGTTIADFTDPEFVICGADQPAHADVIRDVFTPLHGEDRVFGCGIETGEAIKVLYNTFISMKIVWANTVMELCHKTAADCDEVTAAISQATTRVISGRYLTGGMGDGGHCHPRDLVAMSWLAGRLDLSYDLLGEMAAAREAQTRWLAQLAEGYADLTGLGIVILGRSYKPGSPLTGGSPALLLASYLARHDPWQWDPHAGAGIIPPTARKAVYVIATAHPEFPRFGFGPGSVVIDPFGYVPDRPGVTVIRVGRKT
jgi:UDPglucose 6-dehydrogenase